MQQKTIDTNDRTSQWTYLVHFIHDPFYRRLNVVCELLCGHARVADGSRTRTQVGQT